MAAVVENTKVWVKEHPVIAGGTFVAGVAAGYVGLGIGASYIGASQFFESNRLLALGAGAFIGASLVIIEAEIYSVVPELKKVPGEVVAAESSIGIFTAPAIIYTAITKPKEIVATAGAGADQLASDMAPVTSKVADTFTSVFNINKGDTWTPNGGKTHTIDNAEEKAAFDAYMKLAMTKGSTKEAQAAAIDAMNAAISKAHTPTKTEDAPTPPTPAPPGPAPSTAKFSTTENTEFLKQHKSNDNDAERLAYGQWMSDPLNKVKAKLYQDSILAAHQRV